MTSRLFIVGVLCQDDDETERKLCADKSAGELFRLKEGEENCRDVIQCTAAVSSGDTKIHKANIQYILIY